MSEGVYDVIVVGGGPAGLTAVLYTARHDLDTLVLEGRKIGGKALEAHWVDNYPGFPEGISGEDLMENMIQQVERFGAEIRNETVVGLSDFDDLKMVTTRRGFYQAKSVVGSHWCEQEDAERTRRERVQGSRRKLLRRM